MRMTRSRKGWWTTSSATPNATSRCRCSPRPRLPAQPSMSAPPTLRRKRGARKLTPAPIRRSAQFPRQARQKRELLSPLPSLRLESDRRRSPGTTVTLVQAKGRLVIADSSTGEILAEHLLVQARHLCATNTTTDGARRVPSRGPRPRTSVRQQFCALGPEAEAFSVGAAAIGNTSLASELGGQRGNAAATEAVRVGGNRSSMRRNIWAATSSSVHQHRHTVAWARRPVRQNALTHRAGALRRAVLLWAHGLIV